MKSILANKSFRISIILLLSYVLLVVIFESMLAYFQPENQSTLQITTTDASGAVNRRVLARLESEGQLYVAANHWPRSWYREALAHPSVGVSSDSETGNYVAVPVEGAEHEAVNADNALGLFFRVLTGFPPRYFLRLDPQN